MFECNLDPAGRKTRIILGVVLLIVAYLVYKYRFFGEATFQKFAQYILAIAGIFTIFEGVMGWCALKALGIKIPF